MHIYFLFNFLIMPFLCHYILYIDIDLSIIFFGMVFNIFRKKENYVLKFHLKTNFQVLMALF